MDNQITRNTMDEAVEDGAALRICGGHLSAADRARLREANRLTKHRQVPRATTAEPIVPQEEGQWWSWEVGRKRRSKRQDRWSWRQTCSGRRSARARHRPRKGCCSSVRGSATAIRISHEGEAYVKLVCNVSEMPPAGSLLGKSNDWIVTRSLKPFIPSRTTFFMMEMSVTSERQLVAP